MNRREFIAATANATIASSIPLESLSAKDARSVDRRAMQELVNDVARSLSAVGGQLAIFDGHEVHEFATGYANLEQDLPVTADTVFQIGSTTKVLNASMLMALVDDGVLSLDAPVKTWIKDFQLPDAEATRRINIRQLISMSAGIDNGSYMDYGRGDDAVDRYVAALSDVPLIFEPGAAFGYSNACTVVSGVAAERATGKSWEMLLAERVLEPLSLKHAASFAEDLLFHSVALGYEIHPESGKASRVPVWAAPRSIAPAGGTMCCSAGDLVRLAGMFLSEGKAASGCRVVSPGAITAMQSPEVTLPTKFFAENWCLGPFQRNWNGEILYGHTGTSSGGSSALLWCPRLNFAVATNCNVNRQGYPFADRIFDVVFPEVFGVEKPATPHPDQVEPADVDLHRFAGRYEALNRRIEFSVDDNRLIARASYKNSKGRARHLTSGLIPLGESRFLPEKLAMSGNRNWDVAFFGVEASGEPTHFLNGVFAMRRVR